MERPEPFSPSSPLVRTKVGLPYCSFTRPAMIPARLSWQSGKNITSTLSSDRCSFSICSAACFTPCRVIALRLSFISFSSPAILAADTASFARNSSNALTALSSLPVAFKHGPITKPRWNALSLDGSTPFASIRAFKPIHGALRIRFKPSFTMIRFSSNRSITSHTVATAASCINSSMHACLSS